MIRVDDLVSDFVGIVHRLDDGVASFHDPGLFQAYAQLSQLARLGFAPIEANAGGIAFSAPEARRAALGEAVERYAAAFVPATRLRRATATELGLQDDVPRYRRFGPSSPHGTDWDADTVLEWVDGYDLTRERPTWAPAYLTFLAASSDGLGHAPHTTSTGLASHTDGWSALRAGLLECIERDAFMASWLDRRPPIARYRWTWEQLRGPSAGVRRGWPQRYELYRLPAAVDEVAVVMGIARGGPGQPAVAVGAAASCDPLSACRKALRETQQTFAWASALQASGIRVADAAEVDDLDAHVAYYIDADRSSAFDFITDSSVPEIDVPDSQPGSARDDVVAIIDALRRCEINVTAVDVTTPDLRSCGVWVVRAVVPQLYPLVIEHGLVLAGHPRLSAGHRPNPDPHPFP